VGVQVFIREKEQWMYSLEAWEECLYYRDRERAALAWAEAVTRISEEPRFLN